MSGSSYRLEAPRPRPPPPPLRFQNSLNSSSILGSDSNGQTLLYDLPSTSSISPPPPISAQRGRLVSPTSPTSRPGRASRGGRPTPPPSANRNRSVTPIGVAPSELEEFEAQCRAWWVLLMVPGEFSPVALTCVSLPLLFMPFVMHCPVLTPPFQVLSPRR
jgi:hypothetical protein